MRGDNRCSQKSPSLCRTSRYDTHTPLPHAHPLLWMTLALAEPTLSARWLKLDNNKVSFLIKTTTGTLVFAYLPGVFFVSQMSDDVLLQRAIYASLQEVRRPVPRATAPPPMPHHRLPPTSGAYSGGGGRLSLLPPAATSYRVPTTHHAPVPAGRPTAGGGTSSLHVGGRKNTLEREGILPTPAAGGGPPPPRRSSTSTATTSTSRLGPRRPGGAQVDDDAAREDASVRAADDVTVDHHDGPSYSGGHEQTTIHARGGAAANIVPSLRSHLLLTPRETQPSAAAPPSTMGGAPLSALVPCTTIPSATVALPPGGWELLPYSAGRILPLGRGGPATGSTTPWLFDPAGFGAQPAVSPPLDKITQRTSPLTFLYSTWVGCSKAIVNDDPRPRIDATVPESVSALLSPTDTRGSAAVVGFISNTATGGMLMVGACLRFYDPQSDRRGETDSANTGAQASVTAGAWLLDASQPGTFTHLATDGGEKESTLSLGVPLPPPRVAGGPLSPPLPMVHLTVTYDEEGGTTGISGIAVTAAIAGGRSCDGPPAPATDARERLHPVVVLRHRVPSIPSSIAPSTSTTTSQEEGATRGRGVHNPLRAALVVSRGRITVAALSSPATAASGDSAATGLTVGVSGTMATSSVTGAPPSPPPPPAAAARGALSQPSPSTEASALPPTKGGRKGGQTSGQRSNAAVAVAPRRTAGTATSKGDPALVAVIESTLLEGIPNVQWDDVAALDEAKRVLHEAAVLPLLVPHLFTGLRRPWKGVLLYGPPGTGKTMLAKAVAKCSERTFFNVSASSLLSRFYGESEKLVKTLFQVARERAPSVIFIDEIDALMGQRGGGGGGGSTEHEVSRRVKTELLQLMDGIGTPNDDDDEEDEDLRDGGGGKAPGKPGRRPKDVLVLAATNRPWDIDDAMRRRLEKRIYVPLPDAEGRRQLLAMLAQRIADHGGVDVSPEQWRDIAARTEGYSGADLTSLMREASMSPMRRATEGLVNIADLQRALAVCEANEGLKVVAKDIFDALTRVRPSVAPHEIARFPAWEREHASV